MRHLTISGLLTFACWALIVAGCSSSSSDPVAPVEPDPEPEAPGKWITIDVTINGDLPVYVEYMPQFGDSYEWVRDENPWNPGDSERMLLPLLTHGYLFRWWGEGRDPILEVVAEETTYEFCPPCCLEDDPCPFEVNFGILQP